MIDSELIKRCQRQDEEAYDILYNTIGKKALWTAYLIVGSRTLAEDVIQEAFFECFRDIKKLRKPELFSVWFNRILTRKSWRAVSKEKKHAADSLEDGTIDTLKDESSVQDIVEEAETGNRIKKLVNSLSTPMRTTVILYYYNDMTISEIAQIMNCFQGTVKSRLHYAKKILQKELRREISIDNFDKPDYDGKECLVHE